MTDPSGHIGCLFDAHFIYGLNLLLIITTILWIRVPINSQVCILYAQKMKRKHSFLPKCILGRHKNWVWLAQKFVIIMSCPSSPCFVTCWDMAMQKSLFDIVRPSTLSKPEKRKPERDRDQGDDTQGKKHKLCPKWLGEFHWLKYDSTEKQMKCKVCLHAYGWKPNPSQNFLHGANNLVLILASLWNTMTFKFL